jgi:hypothetical protein
MSDAARCVTQEAAGRQAALARPPRKTAGKGALHRDQEGSMSDAARRRASGRQDALARPHRKTAGKGALHRDQEGSA